MFDFPFVANVFFAVTFTCSGAVPISGFCISIFVVFIGALLSFIFDFTNTCTILLFVPSILYILFVITSCDNVTCSSVISFVVHSMFTFFVVFMSVTFPLLSIYSPVNFTSLTMFNKLKLYSEFFLATIGNPKLIPFSEDIVSIFFSNELLPSFNSKFEFENSIFGFSSFPSPCTLIATNKFKSSASMFLLI